MNSLAIKNFKAQSDVDMVGFRILNCPSLVGGMGFNVKTFGAMGDGSTDDTVAIQNALAAIPGTGGVFYYPAGRYNYRGAPLVLDRPITVLGDGGVGNVLGGTPISISEIDFNSGSASLFDVQTEGCAFSNIGLLNTSVSAPTAGAGIVTSSNAWRTRYENVSVQNFYIGIDVQEGGLQTFNNCLIRNPVLYGIKLQFVSTPDGGDHAISNCYIYTGSRNATSAIRIESGGGVKIINTKINSGGGFVNGIDLAVTAGIATVDLLIANCSIEGFTGVGIKGTLGAGASWREILLTGNQLAGFGATPYGINFDGTGGSAYAFSHLMLTGNFGLAVAGSSNPFIRLASCLNSAVVGNAHSGFSDLFGTGTGVTFALSAVIPPGGTTGQSLKKASNANYDVAWVT
jgi:hypothetical protein